MEKLFGLLFVLAFAVSAHAQTLGPPTTLNGGTNNIGTATGTSLALGGATIGANALAVTGTTLLGTATYSDGTTSIPAMAFVSDPTTGFYRSGTSSIGAVIAGTDRFHMTGSAVFSNSSNSWYLPYATASATVPSMVPNATSTTTGIGGTTATLSLIVAGAEQMRIAASGALTLPAIPADTAQTDSTVCVTSAGVVYKGTGAVGICLGTSGAQFKTGVAPMVAGIDDLMKINFVNYNYKNGFGDNGVRRQYGTTAQEVEAALPDIARHNEQGETINFDSGALLFVGLHAIQQLKAENNALRACNASWKCRIFGTVP